MKRGAPPQYLMKKPRAEVRGLVGGILLYCKRSLHKAP